MEVSTTKQLSNKALEDLLNNPGPLEAYFFTEKEKQKIEDDRKKLDMTDQYYKAVKENPDYWSNLERATIAGQIFSSAQADLVSDRLKALDGSGLRMDLLKSIIHPKGHFILMSEQLAQNLNLSTDWYIAPDRYEALAAYLKKEGIGDADLARLKTSLSQYGAILVQRGVFVALKELLEEALAVSNIKASFEMYKRRIGQPTPTPTPTVTPASAQSPMAHGSSLTDLRSRIQPGVVATSKPPVSPDSIVPVKTSTPPPPLTPTEIKREVATKELPSEPKPAIPTEPQLFPKAPTPPIKVPVPPPPPPPKPRTVGPLPGLPKLDDIVAVEDLRKIQPGHLRQGYLPDQIKLIKSKIAYLAGTNRVLPVQVANIFQESPLFKLYLKMGRILIESSGMDKKATFKELAGKMAMSGEESLSVEEFEAIADLRKELEQM